MHESVYAVASVMKLVVQRQYNSVPLEMGVRICHLLTPDLVGTHHFSLVYRVADLNHDGYTVTAPLCSTISHHGEVHCSPVEPQAINTLTENQMDNGNSTLLTYLDQLQIGCCC